MAAQGVAQKPSDLSAVLTQIDGQVTLSSKSRAQFRSVRLAARRQILRGGEVVHVPAGAQVSLVCSTDNLVSLTGPRDWVLDPAACGQGRPLPKTSYRNLASYAGRILPKNGSLLLEMEPRTVELRLSPILLSPRNTATLDAYPRLVWTQAPDALEYEIKLRGPVDMSIKVARAEIQCGRGSGPWRGLDICSWAASGKWPALEHEKPVSLSLGSRQTPTASFRQVDKTGQLHLVSATDQQNAQEVLHLVATLPVDKASRLLLTAGAYAQVGLYADAIGTYEEALDIQEIPEARVTLGDLYLKIGLAALADREYRQVLAGSPDSAARAAAESGLGQVAYFRRLFDEARGHFERAHALYASLGLPVEAEEARAAAARL